MIGLYFLIGIIYTLINGLVRKLDTDGDFMLPLVWILFWPIPIIALLFKTLDKLRRRRGKDDENTGTPANI